MTIKEWLEQNRKNQDSEIILSYILKQDQTFLITHENDTLTDEQIRSADRLIKMRNEDEKPLAYVLQEKEFYGRKFYVDERVLVPRPETEALIDAVKAIVQTGHISLPRIADVGTGSACIAITLKLELPDAKITAFDISESALAVAKRNAKQWQADIKFIKTDLIDNQNYDIIVANLPYVDRSWDWASKTLRFEPAVALFAEDGGKAEIKRLLEKVADSFVSNNSAVNTTSKTTYLVLELDKSQKNDLLKFAQNLGYQEITIPSQTSDYLLVLKY